jgi:hypothetical protein
MKNRRVNHYRNGWLDVPEKYGYLKNNANKRDPTASRTKKALSSTASAKQATKDLQDVGGQKGKRKVVRLREDDSENDNDRDKDCDPDDGEDSD